MHTHHAWHRDDSYTSYGQLDAESEFSNNVDHVQKKDDPAIHI